MEFHHVDALRSLARPLADPSASWDPPEAAVFAAKTHPPPDTRAALRSRVMRHLAQEGRGCFVDWEVVDTDGVGPLMMLNPFECSTEIADRWMAEVRSAPPPGRHRITPPPGHPSPTAPASDG